MTILGTILFLIISGGVGLWQWRRDIKKRQQEAAAKDLQMHKNEQIAQSINVVQKNEADKTHSTDFDNLESL